MQIDVLLHYMGRWELSDLDSYTRLDVRLAWRPEKALEIALVGQNLLRGEHAEEAVTGTAAAGLGIVPTEVERAVYASLTCVH